jgi:hypothetical protein
VIFAYIHIMYFDQIHSIYSPLSQIPFTHIYTNFTSNDTWFHYEYI